jgi:cell division protein FtsI (penicillin-binding protein 3)
VKPRLILKKGDAAIPPAPPVAVLKSPTAVTMRQMMEGVVLFGTGTQARIQGYTVGGKTGSAQIFDVASHHYTHTYNGSFMGMAPMTNPALVTVVTLNGTHGTAGFGGASAAPVFRVVAGEALRVLDVPKDNLPADTTVLAQVVKPDTEDLADADTDSDEPNILEEGDDDVTADVNAPRVPNFKGMSMRAVLAEAAAKGLTVIPDGSGIARVQAPRAGSVLHGGERIRVQFAR